MICVQEKMQVERLNRHVSHQPQYAYNGCKNSFVKHAAAKKTVRTKASS
jgi:hypothetical protein